jgi:hypothetical protein
MLSRIMRVIGVLPGNPQRTWVIGALVVMVVSMLMIPVARALSWDRAISNFIFPIVAGVSVLVFAFCAVLGIKYVIDAERMEAGDYLARWEYSAEEWEKHSENEWARARASVKQGLIRASIATLFFTGAAIYSLSIDMARDFRTAFGLALLVAAIAFLPVGFQYVTARFRYARRAEVPKVVYISDLGVYWPPVYRRIVGVNHALYASEIEGSDPFVLVLVSMATSPILVLGTFSRQGRTENRIAVPGDRLPEAQEIRNRFKSRINLDDFRRSRDD